MPIHPSKRGDKVLKIKSQNGFSDNPLFEGKSPREINDYNSIWEFSREGNNHAYLSNGEIKYKGNCENNLIISSRGINLLDNVKNSFIFATNQYIEATPISNFKRISKIGIKTLTKNKIKYNIPVEVIKRESLINHDIDKIRLILEKSYEINAKEISLISSGRSRFGRYFIRDIKGKKYVFKYRGLEKKEVEDISTILSLSYPHFPRPYNRIDKPLLYGIKLEDGFYGLEDFIEGDSIKEKNLGYIRELGKTIALLHNDLENILLEKNSKLNLISRRENFSESNMYSIYLDIIKDKSKSSPLIPFIEDIIDNDLSFRMRTLPKEIIHGDINCSNVIHGKKGLVIIDPETLNLDKRLKEFISPLLLEGNMAFPTYLKNGLPTIIESYNTYAKRSLSKEEVSVLPDLIQAAILKYYVIREIRRGNKESHNLERTIENLEKIKEDSNDY